MKKICFFIFVFSLSKGVFGQPNRSLNVILTTSADSIYSISTLHFKVAIKNNSDTIIELLPLVVEKNRVLSLAQIYLEINNFTDSNWIQSDCIINQTGLLAHYVLALQKVPKIQLLPRSQLISEEFICPTPSVMQNQGSYLIRLRFVDLDGQLHYSIPERVVVLEYSKQDYQAMEYLKQAKRANFLFTPVCYIGPYDTTEIIHAENIVKDYPGSQLAMLSELYLCAAYVNKAKLVAYYSQDKRINSPETIRSLHYLRLSKKYGLAAQANEKFLYREKAKETLVQLKGVLYDLVEDPSGKLFIEFSYPFKY